MDLNTKQHFQKAEAGGYALGQFNVSTADQMRAVMEAGRKFDLPVMVGTSEGEWKFLGARQAVKLCEAYEEDGLQVILNADHTKSLENVKKALEAGYNSIHFDGSELPYEENIALTKQAVEMARAVSPDISVEGELGHIGGTGSSKVFTEEVKIDERHLTDPQQALDFMERTCVDRLGVAIGNLHGISLAAQPKLDIERLGVIRKILAGKCILVLHGGSGIPDEQIQAAIQNGIRKINVNTELRIAFTGALKTALAGDETTPYKYFAPAIDVMQKVVEQKVQTFKAI